MSVFLKFALKARRVICCKNEMSDITTSSCSVNVCYAY